MKADQKLLDEIKFGEYVEGPIFASNGEIRLRFDSIIIEPTESGSRVTYEWRGKALCYMDLTHVKDANLRIERLDGSVRVNIDG